MNLNKKTLEKLRNLINEETEYRSGSQLVKFFNNLGFNDQYGQGFPSRWRYTDDKLKTINGEEEFQKESNETEIEFLEKEFKEISLEKINLNPSLIPFLDERINEIEKCLSSNSPLSVIFLCGSTLEGLLLGTAENNPRDFNSAKSAPKDREGKIKKLHNWTLNNFIDVACEVGFIKEDVKKYSHSLRDFRNYIHPYEQMVRNFSPDIQSAKISCQVLKAALYQLSDYQKNKI